MEAKATIPKQIPDEILSTLSVKWMRSFEAAARGCNKPAIMALFSEGALICGAQKDGPLDHVLSRNFTWHEKQAKLKIHSPHVLVVLSWEAASVVVGGPTRKGDVTLCLVAEIIPPSADRPGSKRFICEHAHFSLIA